jgi:hypothetical protein
MFGLWQTKKICRQIKYVKQAFSEKVNNTNNVIIIIIISSSSSSSSSSSNTLTINWNKIILGNDDKS